MRIAIVECDVPLPTLKDKYGDYTQYFKTLLTASVDPSTAQTLNFIQFEAYLDAPLPQTAEDLKDIDGLILSGSRFTSYDNDPWILRTIELVKLAYANNVKLVGICFGHQLIARALGGTVALNPKGWEIAVTTATIKCELLPPTMTTLRLQQMHRDIVDVAPRGAQVCGGNEICEVQSMYEPNKLFTVQGHPEFNADTVKTVLKLRMDQNIVPIDYGTDAMVRADLEHDGLAVGAAIIKFFTEKK